MQALSERQNKILQFIIAFFSENEFPPTIREIGEKVGISSTSVVNYNLAKLEELGYITRRKEVSRGLSLNWDRLMESDFAPPEVIEHASQPLPGMRHINGSSNGLGNDGQLGNGTASMLRVPLLGRIAAGEPIQVEAREVNNPDDWIEVPEGLFNTKGSLFALRVQGDSMIDASVLDGDVVIIRHQETANDGDMVAAWIEGDEETTLKYLFREGRNVRLQPANPNPEYQPIIRPANKVRINGKVVFVLRVLEH